MTGAADEREEPVLEVAEIQAHVLAGFAAAPVQTCLFVEITEVAAAKRWLGRVAGRVTPLAAALPGGGVAAAFTYQGLERLAAPGAERFGEMAFKEGLHRRSGLLGDPSDERARGHPRNWVVGGPGRVPDALLLVAAPDPGRLADEVARVLPGGDDGARIAFRQDAAALDGPHGPREHFGFRDPVSQPGVRGRRSADPGSFLTPRRDHGHGCRGERLVWPGEFVFGYPRQDAMDLLRPGPVAEAGPPWARNGSFLVVRRLHQDVAAFRAFLAAAAAAVSRRARARFEPEALAAKLVGRWPSGAPLALAPERDDRALARDDARADDFGFAADPLGLACPQAAHIRKAYPRDHPTSEIVAANVETHRLLRRGVPYGPPFPLPGDRGLLFLAYQTSFERQFEFVTRGWLNNPNLRDEGDGHDPIAGQNGRGPERRRRFVLPVANQNGAVTEVALTLDRDWVVPTGGGYFFAPSLSALRLLAG